MIEWAIYYGDGSRFTNEDGSPWDAPRLNVQTIVSPHWHLGYEIQTDSDYYYYDEEANVWFIADTFAIWDVLIRCKHPVILFGRYISTEEYMKIVRRALSEMPGKKATWRRGEPSWLKGD